MTFISLRVENNIRYACYMMTQKISSASCKNIAPSAFCFDSNPMNESKFSKSVLVLQSLHL